PIRDATEPPPAADCLQRALRARFRQRLRRSVRWPARRGGGGTSYPRAWGVWVVQGGWHPGRASVGCGGPGRGARGAHRKPLPPPNHALEPTAPSGRFSPCGSRSLGAAAHRERSASDHQSSLYAKNHTMCYHRSGLCSVSTEETAMVKHVKVIVEKHPDGYVAYPLGLKGVIVGEGDTYEETPADGKSAITLHLD